MTFTPKNNATVGDKNIRTKRLGSEIGSAEWTRGASRFNTSTMDAGINFEIPEGECSESENALDKSIESIADYVVQHKIEAAVLFFLEAHIPMTSVLHSVSLLLQPIMTPLFGAEKIGITNALLSDRNSVQSLILAIEKRARRPLKTANSEVH